MAAALVLKGLACARAGRLLFSGLPLQLPPGRQRHVAGTNGAGKTSLLRMVCGLLAPTRGAVRWRDRPVRASDEDFHRDLLYLGHAAALKDDLSCQENLTAAGGER